MNNDPNLNNGIEPEKSQGYAPDVFADAPKPQSKGLAITSLIFGIIAALGSCCFCPPLGAAFGIAAIVLAVIYSKRNSGLGGMALAGLILGIVSIVISVVFLLVIGLNYDVIMESYEEILKDMPQNF